jgi:FtsZ-interacting cell division protein ZipA
VAESHEPSYYEIALTNRQVVVAFVILLTCLLGAFFSGIWIGREGSVRAAQEQIVRNTPPESKEGKNLEELEFFDKNKKAADATKSDPQEAHPSLGTTLLEDIGVKKKPAAAQPAAPPAAAREEPAPPAQAQPAAAVPAPPAPDPAQERRERRKARAAAAAAAAAQQAPAEAVPATTAAPAPAKPAKTAKAGKTGKTAATTPKGAYVIQVFSSADQAQAERIRAKLVAGGQTAYLSPIERGGRTMYRVRVGPFKSRDEAQKVSEKVRKGYKLDTWVTE